MRGPVRAFTASLVLVLVGCATSEPSLRLVFYTDVHARTEWETPVALDRVRDAINAEQPDLVIATGDLITDGFEAASPADVSARWDAYLELHEGIEAEVYPAIGNHDLVAANPEDGSPAAADPRAVARERLGLERTFYTFEHSGYRFFLLDSTEVTGGELQYRGYIGEEQLAWLEAELASVARETPIVVALHIPLLTSFYSATEGGTFAAPANRVLVNNREVLALFEEHNLVLVLQGHLQAKELSRWRDTTFITGGAVCGKWWRGAWFGTEPGYNVVTLEGNHVEWDYVEYGWTPRRPRGR
ncbi:MAG: metallophosphoesterase family protein [Myxococcota bacterium]